MTDYTGLNFERRKNWHVPSMIDSDALLDFWKFFFFFHIEQRRVVVVTLIDVA